MVKGFFFFFEVETGYTDDSSSLKKQIRFEHWQICHKMDAVSLLEYQIKEKAFQCLVDPSEFIFQQTFKEKKIA